MIVQVDLVETGSTKRVIDETMSKYGSIDILVSGAMIDFARNQTVIAYH